MYGYMNSWEDMDKQMNKEGARRAGMTDYMFHEMSRNQNPKSSLSLINEAIQDYKESEVWD